MISGGLWWRAGKGCKPPSDGVNGRCARDWSSGSKFLAGCDWPHFLLWLIIAIQQYHNHIIAKYCLVTFYFCVLVTVIFIQNKLQKWIFLCSVYLDLITWYATTVNSTQWNHRSLLSIVGSLHSPWSQSSVQILDVTSWGIVFSRVGFIYPRIASVSFSNWYDSYAYSPLCSNIVGISLFLCLLTLNTNDWNQPSV